MTPKKTKNQREGVIQGLPENSQKKFLEFKKKYTLTTSALVRVLLIKALEDPKNLV